MALEITDNNFKEILAEGSPVVIDFWAPWCGPCKMVGPIIDELAKEYEGKVIMGKCDVDENSDLPAEFGIRNIPTVLFFKNGELEKFSEDELYYFLDLIDEYYSESGILDVQPDADGYVDIDLEQVVEFIVKEAKKDEVGEYDPEDILFVVQGEMEYGNSLGQVE